MKSVVLRAGALLLALWGCVCVAHAGDAGLCHIKRAVYLDTFPDGGMRPRVKVSLNGAEEYFVVDTAGVYSAVAPQVVKDLALETKFLKTRLKSVASGAVPDHIAIVDDMKVGPLPLPHMSLVVMPEADIAGDSQGLLSGEFLHLFDLELNPAAHKLSLFLHNGCGDKVVYWTHGPRAALDFRMNRNSGEFATGFVRRGPDWHIVVPAKLDGEDVSVTIDSGASTSAMQMGDAEEMLSAEQREKLEVVPQITYPDRTVYSYPFGTLDFGGVKVTNPKIRIFPGARSNGAKLFDLKPQLILGQDVLSKLHLYIAYEAKRLYITAASAH